MKLHRLFQKANAIGSGKDTGLQEEAWVALQPQMEKLKNFTDFALNIGTNLLTNVEKAFPKIIKKICEGDNPIDSIMAHPGCTKQMVVIMNLCFKFDQMKTLNPAIQNDLSFYRRVLSQGKNSIV
ncbi:hypothetical protein HZS_7003 [Henneguya salminicola]|nr:hypothetical protein HZS_7003 [Henneguya salminicola]